MAIHRQGNALVCVATFLASGAGATGLAVSVDVYELPLASGTPALIVSGGSATEIARGAYYYRLASSSVDATALYVFLFNTAGTADQKVVAQGWTAGMAWTEALDQAITSAVAAVLAKLPSALVGGRIDASVGAMAADTITSAALAASAVTEMQTGLATSVQIAAVMADTDDIQARLPAALVAGRMDSHVGAIAADAVTAAALAADAVSEIQSGLAAAPDVAAIQADTDDILARLPAALVDGRMDAHVGEMAVDALDAAALAADAVAEISAAVSTGASLAEIADAVWDEATPHDTPGTMGALLTAAEASGDPLANPVPNGYASGTAGFVLGSLNPGNLSIVNPLADDGKLTLIKGDSYTAAEGRAIVFTMGLAIWPVDLTGYTITITIDMSSGSTMLTDSLTITAATGAQRSVQWEPTSAETGVLTTGTWSYEIKATKGAEVARLVMGACQVKAGTT